MKRQEWVENARAIGIILVVYGHTHTPEAVDKFIFSFHMPLFFFISGYLYKVEGVPKFFLAARKALIRLVRPYYFYALLGFLAWYLVLRHYGGSAADSAAPQSVALASLLGTGTIPQYSVQPVVLWFLPCLFSVQIITWTLINWLKPSFRYTTVIAMAFLGCQHLKQYALPYELESALIALPFFLVGYWIRNAMSHNLEGSILGGQKNLVKAFVGLSLVSVQTLVALNNLRIDVRLSEVGNIFFFYTAAFLGIFGTIVCCSMFRSTRLTFFLGSNTLVLFALHTLTYSAIKGVAVLLLGFDFTIFNNYTVAILVTFLNLALTSLAVPVVKRFAPWAS